MITTNFFEIKNHKSIESENIVHLACKSFIDEIQR